MPNFDNMRVSTIREFDGGWNAVTSDLNLPTKYSIIENNVFYGISGAKQKRYGTKFFTNVKSYERIAETYNNINVESSKIITINQDTIHSVNVGNTITVTSPASLAGTYTVVKNYYTSFTVYTDKTELNSNYSDVVYKVNNNDKTSMTTSVHIVGNTITFIRNKNILVKKDKQITITAPSTLIGTYDVIYADGNLLKFTVPFNTNTSDLSNIEYTYTVDGDNQSPYTKYASSGTVESKQLLVFEPNDNQNVLLKGHTLFVSYPAELSDTYIVIDKTPTTYKIDITSKNPTKTLYETVMITHDNRNIQGTRLINGEYFLDKIIAVSNLGEVIAIDATGDAIILFNDEIARQNNIDITNGWGETDHVCFTVFNGILTLWNGRNKPLYVDLYNTVPCNFLVDEATQTNSMIPIAKYAIAINHYLVVGNCYDEVEGVWHSDRIYISDYDTIATFNDGSEDPIDNGGIFVDIGKIVSTSLSEIRGLSRYRTQLIVSFDEVSVLGTLGTMIDQTTADGIEYKLHKPDFSDVISDFGCISNRTFQTILGDVCCLSYNGVGLFRKQVLSSLTTCAQLATIIGPELYKTFKDLSEDALNNRVWSVFNPKEQQYMLFIPNNSTLEQTTETKCFVYTIPSTASLAKATTGAWSLFTGWNFQWGCTSALNEVFFCDGSRIFVLGNQDRPYYADFMDDPRYPADEETGISGVPITFEWEFGWQDFGNRVAKKTLRYIRITSTGTSQYTFGTWYDYLEEPECEMKINLVGGDANGWGAGRQLYGGSRRTSTEELFAYTAKFDLTKMRIYGTSKEDLKISAISLFFLNGNIRR